MTNPPPQRERARTVSQAQRRQVALPGAQQGQRRGGLLLLGLLLVFGAGFGFWFVLQSIDQRAEYLIAARTIERWEVARAQDFTLVEANVGTASALTVDQFRMTSQTSFRSHPTASTEALPRGRCTPASTCG